MDIKNWFENGTGLTIKELRWLKSPSIPFNIYIDNIIVGGADKLNNVAEHNLIIEHYSNNTESSNEKTIEDFLNKENLDFNKNKEWLEEEQLFVTIYEMTFLEKIRKEGI